MKPLLLLVVLVFAACAHQPPAAAQRAAPSLTGITRGVTTAHAATKRAEAHSVNIASGASALRRNADRIDAKASVVLEWLNR